MSNSFCFGLQIVIVFTSFSVLMFNTIRLLLDLSHRGSWSRSHRKTSASKGNKKTGSRLQPQDSDHTIQNTFYCHLPFIYNSIRLQGECTAHTHLKARGRLHYTYEKEQGSKSNSLLKKRSVIAFLYSLSLFLTLSQSVACAHYLSAHLGSHFRRTKINP